MEAAELYAVDPRPWLASVGLWAGPRSYDDEAKAYVARSGHYLDSPPPGALYAVSLEPLVPGLFGPVPSGRIVGMVVVGRPIARMLPQDGTVGEILRFVLDRPMPHHTASHVLRVTAELFAKRPRAEHLISYHDRSLHTGCIYKKAGFRKDGVSRAGTRRGSWGTRPNREQAMSSEETSKRRWRLDVADVLAGLSERARILAA